MISRKARSIRCTVLTLFLVMIIQNAGCGGETGPDTVPPDMVLGVVAAVDGTMIKVFWNPSTASDLSHYLLYMGTRTDSMSSIGEEIPLTSKFLYNLTVSVTYYFSVTAVDRAGNESTPSPVISAVPTSAEYEISQGWDAFAIEDYSAAMTSFNLALQMESDNAEAYLGLGWSKAMSGMLTGASYDLNRAITEGLTTLHANSGLAVVYRDLPDLLLAIANAKTVLQGNPSYTFLHRTSIDHRDMRLVIAQCYFRMGESYFPLAQAQVDTLEPANGLDPGNPSTWNVDGTTYQSYALALMRMIMKLETSIGG